MPFACLYIPDFPLEALLRAEPRLRSQPLAVLEGKPPLQKVFVVNEHAHSRGVTEGMTKLQVEALPGLEFRARSSLLEATAHAALLDCAQSFSPRVEDTEPDTIILDLLGMESLFGTLPRIARDLAHCASKLGLNANVAVAENPDTAMLAARGFRGTTIIPNGKEAERLGALPIEILFIRGEDDSPILETYLRWGIRTLRELAALRDVALSERLGQRGIYLQKLARGEISRTLMPADPPLIFEEAAELEYPLTLLEPLAFLLNQMLEQLCARLAARALATQELQLELELQNEWDAEAFLNHVGTSALARPGRAQARQRFQRTLHLPLPLLNAKTFLKLLQLDLNAHPPGAPIVKIHLSAKPARPRPGQGGLFLPPSPEPEKLELTLARIAAIVGEEKVGSPAMLDTHRPEGFRMQKFSPPEPREKSKPENLDGLITALRIFRPPSVATVTVSNGKPSFISCHAHKETHGEVLWAAGPWRSSGDWWEQNGWARDEWDIAVREETSIALYRLVRDLLKGCWLLEGSYD